jgi:hypothetical protein
LSGRFSTPHLRLKMTSTVDEFHDLLSAETSVDMHKLRYTSQHGIPDSVRPLVWKYVKNKPNRQIIIG